MEVILNLNDYCRYVTLWRRKKGFVTEWDNMLEKLMLVVTEVSEAAEAFRSEEYQQFWGEIADSFIRLMDVCGTHGIDIEEEIKNKMKYNEERPYKHGKKV